MKNKEKKRHNQIFVGKMAVSFFVVHTTWKTPTGESQSDFQMLQVPQATQPEQVQKDILEHVQEAHPDYEWHVHVFDADNVPPNTIPDGTTFRLDRSNAPYLPWGDF